MTMPGRAAAPAKLRLLEGRGHGRDSGGRVVPDTPQFRRVPPAKPDYLSAEASAHWDLVVPELVRLELVKAEDQGSLAQLCETFAVWRAARDDRAERGLTIKNPSGRTAPNPAVVMERQASADYRNWAREFGLTPSAESRLSVKAAPDGDTNPFAADAT